VEQVLQRDPSGSYGRMDFVSRDRYRRAVEELASPTAEAQLEVALRVVERARQALSEPSDERVGHVGWYLIDKGRPEFEKQVGRRRHLAYGLERTLFRHGSLAYLGSLAALTVAFTLLALERGAASRGVSDFTLVL